MLVKTTVGSMLNSCHSVGMITEDERYEIAGELTSETSLSPSVKIQVFKRYTGYSISVDYDLLKRQEYSTKIIVSNGLGGDILPAKQKQPKSNCKSIW